MEKQLPKTFTVDNQDPQTTCPDGKTFDECETAQLLLDKNKSYRMDENRATANGNYVRFVDDTTVCEACKFICYISLKIVNLEPSGEARLICREPGTN